MFLPQSVVPNPRSSILFNWATTLLIKSFPFLTCSPCLIPPRVPNMSARLTIRSPTALIALILYSLSGVQISSKDEKVDLSWVRNVVTAEMVLPDSLSCLLPSSLRASLSVYASSSTRAERLLKDPKASSGVASQMKGLSGAILWTSGSRRRRMSATALTTVAGSESALMLLTFLIRVLMSLPAASNSLVAVSIPAIPSSKFLRQMLSLSLMILLTIPAEVMLKLKSLRIAWTLSDKILVSLMMSPVLRLLAGFKLSAVKVKASLGPVTRDGYLRAWRTPATREIRLSATNDFIVG